MSVIIITCVLLTAMSVFSGRLKCVAEFIAEDCGDIQYDVENGMIRLLDFSGESIHNLNCSWTYTAPAGRKLLVKVDNVHLPPLELRISQFQLYIDDMLYDVPRNCIKCLREIVSGKVLKVIFTSYLSSSSESNAANSNETSTIVEGIGSFQIRYKAFDPDRCTKPEQIENGFIINNGRKLGQSIYYHCNQPYDLIGDSELLCIATLANPVPQWSNKIPKCAIPDCTGETMVKEGPSGAIATPGYPYYIYQFSAPCKWGIIALPTQQIKISIKYLKFPKSINNSLTENAQRLSLLDGDYDSYITNITESLTSGPLNFTTITNKLSIVFIVNGNPKVKEEAGVYLTYALIFSSCADPRAPFNGDAIVYSTDLGSTVVYRCNDGYFLVGEINAQCLFNGQWSHPTPSCEPINFMPSFFSATNNSDTVTAKLAEIPVAQETQKYSKNSKKKAFEIFPTKNILELFPPKDAFDVLATKSSFEDLISPNFTNEEGTFSESKDNISRQVSTVFPENSKIYTQKSSKQNNKDSGNGPKSETHLLQVVPPKENGKKHTEPDSSIRSPITNISEPVLDTGRVQEINIGGIRFSFTLIYIIAGVGIPLILIIVVFIVIVVVYRRRYPVRMRFGRKFSTFENPMYVSKDAQHPRELKRLTT